MAAGPALADPWPSGWWPLAPRSRLYDTRPVTETPLTGSCLCGGVRFEITALPTLALYCHCTRCQSRTGTSQSAQMRLEGGTFRLLAGEELLRFWRHPERGQEKGWCGNCGSHLVSRDPEARFEGKMSVRMSALDGDPPIMPTMRVHTASAASWESIPGDGLQCFEGLPPGIAESDDAYSP